VNSKGCVSNCSNNLKILKILQRLKNFEIEKDVLIEKIKSLEDALMKSKLPMEKPFDSVLTIDSVASSLCLHIELLLVCNWLHSV
jgi:hypothetical protein